MNIGNVKLELDVLQSHNLRALVQKVNDINVSNYPNTDKMILKEDIVDIIEQEGTYFLLYYKELTK